jgi:hypothetical protein
MNLTIFSIFSIFYLIVYLAPLLNAAEQDSSSAAAFTLFPMDAFQRKFGQITDKILSWSPFGGQNSRRLGFNDAADELDLFEGSDANMTVRRHYFYGCDCKSLKCNCCAHIEVAKTKFNHTGEAYYILS